MFESNVNYIYKHWHIYIYKLYIKKNIVEVYIYTESL